MILPGFNADKSLYTKNTVMMFCTTHTSDDTRDHIVPAIFICECGPGNATSCTDGSNCCCPEGGFAYCTVQGIPCF